MVVEQDQKVGAQNDSAPVQLDPWRVLVAAYDMHYRRVYRLTPRRKKRVSGDDVQMLTLHLVELTQHLQDVLRERGVPFESVGTNPLRMVADEALRTWFDSGGQKGFLRRANYPMKLLVDDFPFRGNNAVATLIEKFMPKPEPRKHLASTDQIGRVIVRDKLAPRTLEMPTFHAMHSQMVRRPEPPPPEELNSADILRILKGLSARSELREFGTSVPLASELEAIARKRGMNATQVSRALDELALRAKSLAILTPQARTNAIFSAAKAAFDAVPSGECGGAR